MPRRRYWTSTTGTSILRFSRGGCQAVRPAFCNLCETYLMVLYACDVQGVDAFWYNVTSQADAK